MIPKITLRSGREKSVIRQHPWIFSGAIASVTGSPGLGETVGVFDSKDHFLCWAAYSPSSQISARIWSWDEAEAIDEDFFHRRISAAKKLRHQLRQASSAIRLVYAESDRLPGLIVDQYADFAVLQLLSAGAAHWKDVIVEACSDILKVTGIYERSDVEVRRLEGLPERTGLLSGSMPPERLIIQEHVSSYWVDVVQGHKTGFYLDQRDNRQKVGVISTGRDVLDCFSYTGGFSIAALSGGANSVTSIDASAEALSIAQENVLLNRLPQEKIEFIEGDVFQQLRTMRDRNLAYDVIILDPPKFAPTKSSVPRASRGYKDINLLAFKLLRPDGYLVTFSCSGAIEEPLFQKIIAGAAFDAGVSAIIVERLHQAGDHPVSLNFPEGAYLKGFVVHKIE